MATSGGIYLPDVFTVENINILDFNGSTISVANPLHSYKFGTLHETFVDDDAKKSYYKVRKGCYQTRSYMDRRRYH